MAGDRFRRVTGGNSSNSPRIGTVGRKAEQKLAKRMGGRLTPGSGNQVGAKGDIVLADVLMETKATEAESYRLELDLLAKIETEALASGKNPAFHVQFVHGDARPKRFGSWVMIPEWLFQRLLGED